MLIIHTIITYTNTVCFVLQRNRVHGCIFKILFDPVDLATSGILLLEIERAITNDEPRVEVENVRVVPYDDRGEFVVFIEYKIVGTEQIYEVSEILTPTR